MVIWSLQVAIRGTVSLTAYKMSTPRFLTVICHFHAR